MATAGAHGRIDGAEVEAESTAGSGEESTGEVTSEQVAVVKEGWPRGGRRTRPSYAAAARSKNVYILTLGMFTPPPEGSFNLPNGPTHGIRSPEPVFVRVPQDSGHRNRFK